ncbi:MAG: NAD(P)/FAD-dependent oxidoreductase, partial [archaeon]|nr:NAD(P)/FAD-dependent oxidoreductase [archaeon]
NLLQYKPNGNMYDTVVIGAGPSGSTTAWKLGEKGKNVALLERNEFAGKTNVCAGGIGPETFSALGITEKVIEKKLKGMLIRTENGAVKKDKRAYLTVRRRIFDQTMAKKAASECDYFTSMPVTKIERIGTNWAVYSGEKKFKTRTIVFADGVSSKLRKKFEIGFIPNKKNCYLALTKKFCANQTPENIEMVFDKKTSPAGYGWMFPKKNHVNIGTCVLLAENKGITKNIDYLIKNYYSSFNQSGCFETNASLIPARIAGKISDARGIVCVGDAAGFVAPLTGEGIGPGIISGAIAAKALNFALEKNDISLTKTFDFEMKKTSQYRTFSAQSKALALLGTSATYHLLHPSILVRNFSQKAINTLKTII